MPRDSNGNVSPPPGTIVAPGDVILPSQHNPVVTEYAYLLSQSLSRDGQGGMRAVLSMNGNRISGVGTPINPTDALRLSDSQSIFDAGISSADVKATWLDADIVLQSDSADGNKVKKVTWSNTKSQLRGQGFVDRNVGNSFSVRQRFDGGHAANFIGTSNVGLGNFQVTNVPGSSCAAIAFNRGPFAAYFGIDFDNKLKIGGWSMGNNAYAIYHEGNPPPTWNPSMGVYRGVDPFNTVFPIGTVLLVSGPTDIQGAWNRNQEATVRLVDGSAKTYGTYNVTGFPCAGTWTQRGFDGNYHFIFQRIA